MENWLILRLEQEVYMMSLEHLVVAESKEVLEKQNKTKQTHNDGGMSEEHRSQLKELPVAKLDQFEQHIK